MKFYSTNSRQHLVTFGEAAVQGLAPDSGLYMPEVIPSFPPHFFETLHQKSFQEIAFDVARVFTEKDIPSDHLKKIIGSTITFDAPLVKIEDSTYALELFHGPTLAFKDFGARFMSQALGYFAANEKKEVVILAATSGDTGSAVANGFLGVPNTKVVVLYPSGKVSEIQEKQFTTLGKNITALEVNGTFDDCQRLVKQAFSDRELNEELFLTSANSINMARLIPQTFYYFYAWSRLPQKQNVVFSVPSGNFGNLTAGLIAQKMGLPIAHFIAATNRNDIVPHFLQTSLFQPKPSVSTISNAMDVGNPSNFYRMLDLFGNDFNKIKQAISGYSFSDEETQAAMQSVFAKQNYVLDPHGAVGYLGLKKYQAHHPEATGVFLETAHPAKFKEVVEQILSRKIPIPEKLKSFLVGSKKSIPLQADFTSLKKILKNLSSGSPV
ncbi:MAG: threonine synthase [Bacteroidetes bacterium]|nr:threonine synthase [Bacteroidota bacterium]MBS1540519.1 threonine synthase [Bacteroidota bacterium]